MQLRPPSERWRDSFLAAPAEFQAEGRYAAWDAATVGDFSNLAARLRRGEMPRSHVPRSGLAQAMLSLIDEDALLGRVMVRHRLDAWA